MNLAERMKMYEKLNSQKLMTGLPAMARLDGKNFSKFTKSLAKPYDKRLSKLMIELSKFLTSETNAILSYTQSDEITLMWYNKENPAGIFYEGKVQKMIGELTALATGFFNRELINYLPEKVSTTSFPRFDARVWNVPSLEEAANSFLYRERDCVKNSISMVAQSEYSHKKLEGKNGSDKQDMLMEKGINWNDYPDFFKRGSYIQRVKKLIPFSAEEIEKLPAKHAARKNPDLQIERNVVEVLHLEPLDKIENKVETLFNIKRCIRDG